MKEYGNGSKQNRKHSRAFKANMICAVVDYREQTSSPSVSLPQLQTFIAKAIMQVLSPVFKAWDEELHHIGENGVEDSVGLKGSRSFVRDSKGRKARSVFRGGRRADDNAAPVLVGFEFLPRMIVKGVIRRYS